MEMVQHKAPVKQMSIAMLMVLVHYALLRKEVMRVLCLIHTPHARLTILNAHQESVFVSELPLTQMRQVIIQPKELVPIVMKNANLMEHVKVNMF